MKVIEKNGRVWKSKKDERRYSKNVLLNLHISLQLESYADDTKDKSVYQTEGFKTLRFFRTNGDKLSSEELLKLTDLIFKQFNETIDKIGREKFITYDDGDVDYNGYEITKKKNGGK